MNDKNTNKKYMFNFLPILIGFLLYFIINIMIELSKTFS